MLLLLWLTSKWSSQQYKLEEESRLILYFMCCSTALYHFLRTIGFSGTRMNSFSGAVALVFLHRGTKHFGIFTPIIHKPSKMTEMTAELLFQRIETRLGFMFTDFTTYKQTQTWEYFTNFDEKLQT